MLIVHHLIYHEHQCIYICQDADLEDGFFSKIELDEPVDWLRRNDSYVPKHRGPRVTATLLTSSDTG